MKHAFHIPTTDYFVDSRQISINKLKWKKKINEKAEKTSM